MNEMELDLQLATKANNIPAFDTFERWVRWTLQDQQRLPAELTIRVVNTQEITHLNENYRKKNGPTNVLSFPFSNPPDVELNLLGDIIICAVIISQEAQQQHKPIEAHWAHMVIHGCLHLLGYDHMTTAEAVHMEALETKLLQELGYADPYQLEI